MDDKSQTTQAEQDALFNKFYENEDLTPENLVESTAPDTTAVPSETPPKAEGEQQVEPEKAAEETTPEVAANAPPSSQSPDPNEWLTKLPANVRGYFEKAIQDSNYWKQKHTEQSSKNRKLHNEVEALKKKVTQPTETDTRTQGEVDEDWKLLEEADPKLAAILKKREQAIIDSFKREAEAKAKEYVEPFHQEREQHYIEEQKYYLTQTVPNWQEVVQDPYFRSWLDSSSPGVKSMYGSLDARDSIKVLQLYASDMQAHFGSQQQQPVQQQQQEVVAPVQQQQSAVTQQRQEKLARSAPIQAQPSGQARSTQMTPDQLFKKLYDDPDAILDMIAKQRS